MQREDLMTMLAGQYPKLEQEKERHARQILASAKGSVRAIGFMIRVAGVVLTVGVMVFSMLRVFHGLLAMLLLILYLGSSAIALWYYGTWRIDFDASTGFVNYYTLFSGENSYHISELMGYSIQRNGKFAMLVILLDDGKQLKIPIESSLEADVNEFSNVYNSDIGYTDVGKFYAYLSLYRRYCFEKGDELPPEPEEQPAVAAVQPQEPLPESMPALQDGETDPNFTELPGHSSHKVQLSKWTDAEAPVRPLMPERSSAFPDPTQSIPAESTPPAENTASKPEVKKDVDVDALFDRVLQQHGKSRSSSVQNPNVSRPASAGKPDVDALFEQVLQQHGKTRDTSVQKRPAQDSLLEQVFRMNRH